MQYDWCPCKEKKCLVKTDTQGELPVMTGRDGSGAAIRRGTFRIDSHHRKLGGGEEGFPELQRERGPSDSLISDLQLPELLLDR